MEIEKIIKNQIALTLVLTVVGLLLSVGVLYIAKRAAIKDVEFVKEITDEESLEKAGKKAKGITVDLSKKKDSFMKGFNSTEDE